MNDDFYLGPNEESYQCEEKIPTAEELNRYNLRNLIPNPESPPRSNLESIIPKCYRDIRKIEPKFEALHEETLFYIFYNHFSKAAFDELVQRGYYFHVKMEFFVQFQGEKVADNTKRKVSYFDINNWSKDSVEILFDKEFVDGLRNEIK